MSLAPRVVALQSGDELRAPAPGYFRRTVAADHLVAPDDIIGELDVLGRITHVTAPRIRGLVKLAPETAARRAVAYGDVLLRVVAAGAIDSATPDADSTDARAHDGLVFRAPTSGRFYGRPSPDKPAFITAGAELATGTTICLLEVMKTFNRVTYSGDRVRVREVLVAEGEDVNAGDPLLALEAP
jgi:acetyl-CoA carboxylase biotin carboxyl carrier protein